MQASLNVSQQEANGLKEEKAELVKKQNELEATLATEKSGLESKLKSLVSFFHMDDKSISF